MHAPPALQVWPVRAGDAGGAAGAAGRVARSLALAVRVAAARRARGGVADALALRAALLLGARSPTQVPPPRPQAVLDGVVLHTPLAQHPPQEAPPQLHAPPLHACPAAQRPARVPRRAARAGRLAGGEDAASRPGSTRPGTKPACRCRRPRRCRPGPDAHVPHAAPPVPHCVADLPGCRGRTSSPSQQPLGHEVASQTHLPLRAALLAQACSRRRPRRRRRMRRSSTSVHWPVRPAAAGAAAAAAAGQAWLTQSCPVAHVAHWCRPVPHSPRSIPSGAHAVRVAATAGAVLGRTVRCRPETSRRARRPKRPEEPERRRSRRWPLRHPTRRPW